MRRFIPLKTLTYSAGGRAIIELDQLPPEHYLQGLHFVFPFDVVAPASAFSAVLPAAFNRLVDTIKIGKRVNVSGAGINALNWMCSGRDNSATAYIPANGNGTFSRALNLFFPFADVTAYEPDDTAPAVELFRDTPIELMFGSDALVAPGRTSFNAGGFQAYAVVRKGSPGKVATPISVDMVDLSGSDSRLDPGVYTHLGLIREDGTAITSAEITGLSVYVDGVPLIDNAKVPELVALFNSLKATGGEPQSWSTTTPFATIPGEALTEQPGGAAAAGATVSTEMLPLLYPANAGKLTAAWPAANGIRIRYTGSATGLRAVTRRIEPVSDNAVAKAAAKMGLAHPSSITPKTASGARSSAWKEALLPKRIPALRR